MNCDEAGGLLADRLKGLLQLEDERKLDLHLESCPACREEAAAITMLWAEMDVSKDDVPSARMRSRFHAALAAYEERSRRFRGARLADWFRAPFTLQAGVAAGLLAIGILIGRGYSDRSEIDDLRQEVRAMSVALLDHQSASERLLGVTSSARIASNAQVADALLDVLRNDSNLNVRLAAVEALGRWADQPNVANALLDTLSREETPLLQAALVDLLLGRNVSNATTVARQLLESENLDPTVRDFVRTSLGDADDGAGADTV